MTMPDPSPPAVAPTPSKRNGFPNTLLHIVVLVVATVVAGWPIASLIEEREARQAGLLDEFRRTWGPEQVVHAPILVVPIDFGEGRPRQYLKIAAADFASTARLAPERKRRGMFAATVYDSAVQMTGRFVVPRHETVATLLERAGVLHWQDSFVLLKTDGLAGMQVEDQFKWQGRAIPWRNCRDAMRRGEECPPTAVAAFPQLTSRLEAGTEISFELTLSLRGSGAYRQVVDGGQGVITMSSPWPSPSFEGDMLPSATTITAEGFEAQWLVRDFSSRQCWLSLKPFEDNVAMRGPSIGVDLIEASPIYRMIHRASKYSILFVVLSFTTYLLFGLLSGIRIHTVQYGLLGVSLTLFTLLLVSFAETLGYGAGYACSAGLVLAQASLYTATVTRRLVPSAIFAAMLAGLFGFLYVLLSLETYALLVGSLALFLVLSVVMVLTRRIDWWGGRA